MTGDRPWQDTSLSSSQRSAALLAAMSLEEKVAQLGSVWPGADREGEGEAAAVENVAPMQDIFAAQPDLLEATRHGLGHVTRPFGSKPVGPVDGAAALDQFQRDLVARTRLPFFAGEEGGPALAGVLSGRLSPSGKLPVQVSAIAGSQPGTYLHPPLGGNSQGVSNLDPTPAFVFGHGLSYASFSYADIAVSDRDIATDGETSISCTVTNTGDRPADEVVQLYLRDPVAQVTSPVTALAGFCRVALAAGQGARVTFTLHADRTAFTGLSLQRVVEPGDIEIAIGSSSADIRLRATVTLHGEVRIVGHDRVLSTEVHVEHQGS